MSRLTSILCAVAFAGGLSVSCTDEGAEQASGACQQIIDACHTKDDGSDETINGCHTLAHENLNNDNACSGQLQMCLDVCNAAPPVGTGGHDTGSHDTGSQDTGSHDTGSHETGSHDTGTHGTGHDTGSQDTGSHDSGTHGSGSGGELPGCAEISTLCHDSQTPTGMMCHDVAHDGDERACAEIAATCVEECS